MTETRFKSIVGLGKYILIGLSLFIILLTVQECRRDEGLLPDQAKDLYKYKTDSVYKGKYYDLKKKYDKRTPPLIVEKWLPGKPGENKIDSVKYIPGELLVYVQGLERELKIKEGFLTKYPDAHKLISFDLQKDSLSITTMDYNADIYTRYYPLALDNYKYQYYDNELHNSNYSASNKLKNKLIPRWNALFLNGGYEFESKLPMAGLEYNLEIGRFKFDAEVKSTFEKNPTLNATGKIGFRLFK